jgi:nucleoside-diphosphate-sugar epimerase
MRVVVVGGAGFIGRALCTELSRQGAEVVVVDKAKGVDITAPDASISLARAFDGAAAVVHLAARVDPATPAEREAMRRLHVDGTKAVVHAARAAGVPRFVLASSAVVYGARASNRVPIDEAQARAPNDDFAYAVDKAAQEDIAADATGLAIARPAIVYGRGARNYLTEIIRRAPVLPALDGRRPQLQFVHVDDVARALALLARTKETGVFNVGNDWVAFEDVAAIARKTIVDIPVKAVAPLLEMLARVMPPHLRAPKSMLPYLMHPFVVSGAKLARLGWQWRTSSVDAARIVLT